MADTQVPHGEHSIDELSFEQVEPTYETVEAPTYEEELEHKEKPKEVEKPVEKPVEKSTDAEKPVESEKLSEPPIPSVTEKQSEATPAAAPAPVTTEVPAKKAVETPLPSDTKPAQNDKNIDFDQDPCSFIKTKLESLIYWEDPKKSATFLAGSFAVLALTQYYSVLQIAAGLFTLTTGINWAYVNLHKQSQRMISSKRPEEIVNPHGQRLLAKTYIPRERILRVAHFLLDVSELAIEQGTKIILVEDNSRSLLAFAASFFAWTLTKCVSTTNLLGFALFLAFSVPRLYSQNKELVDSHVEKHSKTVREMADQYGVSKVFS